MYIADRASTLSSKRLSENGNAVRGGVMSASPKFESLSRAVLTYHERFRAEHPRFRQTSARKWRWILRPTPERRCLQAYVHISREFIPGSVSVREIRGKLLRITKKVRDDELPDIEDRSRARRACL